MSVESKKRRKARRARGVATVVAIGGGKPGLTVTMSSDDVPVRFTRCDNDLIGRLP